MTAFMFCCSGKVTSFFCQSYFSAAVYKKLLHISYFSLSLMAPGSTTRQCSACYKEIGSASKTCKHCGIKIIQKKNLKSPKLKFDDQWAAKLKKDGNSCKIMNCVDLLLHKLQVLGFSPMLFITTQKGQHRSTKILVKNVNIQSHPSVPVMQRLYEAVVRASAADNFSVDPAPLANISASTADDSSAAISPDSNGSASSFVEPVSVADGSASSFVEPVSVADGSASSFVEPVSVANGDSSAATSLKYGSASSFVEPVSVADGSASSFVEPVSVADGSASFVEPVSVADGSASSFVEPVSVADGSASFVEPVSVADGSASSFVEPVSVANGDSSAATSLKSDGSASSFVEPVSVANGDSSAATSPKSNNSAFAAGDSTSAANVFYMPTQRKRRRKHNGNGKKRISFPMAALRILWQEVEEYLGLGGSYAVVTIGQYCLFKFIHKYGNTYKEINTVCVLIVLIYIWLALFKQHVYHTVYPTIKFCL
ncbi:uncharacterized protein LOC120491072 isoform X2 [Pimephales promelas]|uniref:uncharacterized protein LOC120491072 isoform X2 n=1 Tax=Pimephales promelas TaxID=90988 RepID=UPI00195599B8|nr:uncharacterized protein LOC120491072 isoform X2 [Pimephales promelas]